MHKIDFNGIIREMTEEELKKIPTDLPLPMKSELEEKFDKLEAAFNLLLEGAIE